MPGFELETLCLFFCRNTLFDTIQLIVQLVKWYRVVYFYSYASATRFLRENYTYIFNGPEGSTDNLLIGMWSKKVRRSHVLKHGTTQDIDKLATATPRNSQKRRGIE